MVSIIVPVYNCIQSLERCVRAILEQTYKDWELLLVDDGATDGSGLLCNHLAAEDQRIRVLHKENGGVSTARNAGLDAAMGEFVLFCDSDDYVDSRWCELLLKAEQAHPERFPVCNYFREQSGKSTVNFSQQIESLTDYVLPEDFFLLYQTELLGTPWNKLFRREILETQKLRFSRELSLGEDLLFNLAYMQQLPGGFTLVREPLYHYVLGNLSSLTMKYHPNLFQMYEQVLSELETSLRREKGAFQRYADGYWTSCFFAFDRVFRSISSPENSASWWQKWHDNKACFYSSRFQRCREVLPAHTIHPVQELALRTNSFTLYWEAVRFTEWASHLRHSRERGAS